MRGSSRVVKSTVVAAGIGSANAESGESHVRWAVAGVAGPFRTKLRGANMLCSSVVSGGMSSSVSVSSPVDTKSMYPSPSGT